MDNNLLEEYRILHNEINQKIALQNTILTFTITTTVAILTIAVSENITIIYLVPFFIIIPMSMRIAYYRSVISKLSAYIIIFLEPNLKDMKWETRNAILGARLRQKECKKKNRKFAFSRNYECLILSIICYLLYVLDYIKDKTITLCIIIIVALPVLFVLWEFIITKRINSLDQVQKEWINEWEQLKNKEENKEDFNG